MTSGVPQIFDSVLRRRHLARVQGTRPPFYAQTLAAEIDSRLSLILRDFQTTLICGPAAGEIRDGLAGTHHLGRIVTAAPVPGPGIDVVFEDEAQPLAEASFDCILSLFSLNSVNDVPGALAQFRQALKPDGLFLGALFAGRTLSELREAWLAAEAELKGGASLRVAPFADMRDLGSLL
ncbi:MAG: class I SAM-dependent methyltransferase, partial [Solimonas sp.]